MKIFKPKFWNKKNSLIGFILFPVSLFLQFLSVLRNKITREQVFQIPVICVGNIYLGGTGKTPLALEIVEVLKRVNKKAATIKKSCKDHEDEFNLIQSRKATLYKNLSRSLAIKEAIKNKLDCVVLDDGFQDRTIHKNLNILCFNEAQWIGNGMTIPSGPLRENFSSLKRCQIVMINGNTDYKFEKKIKKISNSINIYYSKYVPINIKKFKKKKLLAFAGIGNPNNFFTLLKKNKLIVEKKISFPDHYNYSLKELNRLITFAVKNNLNLITTEKDFFRIKHFKLSQIQCLNVKLEILNKKSFENEIIKYL